MYGAAATAGNPAQARDRASGRTVMLTFSKNCVCSHGSCAGKLFLNAAPYGPAMPGDLAAHETAAPGRPTGEQTARRNKVSNVLAATFTGALSKTLNPAMNPAMNLADVPVMNLARHKGMGHGAAASRPALTKTGALDRLLDLALYFLTPEDSSRPMPLRRSRSHKAAKALFWVAASIAMGILLAQLG